MTKFESIKFKCYFTTLLDAIAVNVLFWAFSSKKKVFLLTILSRPVSLNQCRWEIESFHNRSTRPITDLTISFFNIFVNFAKNVLVYIILIVNMIFLTPLDQFSSCNIIYLWNFMTYFTIAFWPVSCQIVWESLSYLCYVEILNRMEIQGLIPVKASP